MQNLEKSMISKLIEIAMEQLKFSYTPYSNFKVGASLLTKNGRFIQGVTLKMQHIHLRTVQNELQFSKQ